MGSGASSNSKEWSTAVFFRRSFILGEISRDLQDDSKFRPTEEHGEIHECRDWLAVRAQAFPVRTLSRNFLVISAFSSQLQFVLT
jgi:hypothetical protein